MPRYKFIRSVADVKHGKFSDGQEVDLNAEQARALAPFIVQLGTSKAPVVETADAHIEAETADVKPARKGKK